MDTGSLHQYLQMAKRHVLRIPRPGATLIPSARALASAAPSAQCCDITGVQRHISPVGDNFHFERFRLLVLK